ncbi:sigma-70 domain-containing protein [Anaerocolumna sp. MB42-C2]|uniref:sigma-70 domain-containing protein n=1 Tax=Anaerocolumna sp. MB42-C2 TaxID=3070997 RepID=UPI0027E1DFA0|nr:sigma-70 domain-containing protein [Anaerocolumna sp. MB42-C2]WMJ85439.1 sigma-70 domain-containing protein [Anaerocolumna sp. MB42-C2]
MEKKDRFQEMLRDILEVAKVQGNQLSMSEIKSLFGDMELNDIQYDHIFAYLAANHISIKGYVATESEYSKVLQNENKQVKDSEYEPESASDGDSNNITEELKQRESHRLKEDSVYLKMYLEDLGAMKEITPEEENGLLDKILKGEAFAKSRYIEANLHYVVKIAQEYKKQGVSLEVSMEDLIQEGNMGLISALEAVSGITDNKQLKELVTEYIRSFMEAAIEEQRESSSFEDTIVKKINYIQDAANELAEDLCREANIHELAAYVKMPEEEIADIINIAAERIKLDDSRKDDQTVNNRQPGSLGHNHNHTHKRLNRSPRIK